jgi:hypothetical protein
MATTARKGLFATKSTEQLLETAEGTSLQEGNRRSRPHRPRHRRDHRHGIFVIIGEAIGESGPALVISFVLAGLTCISASRYRYHPATAGRSTFLRSSL